MYRFSALPDLIPHQKAIVSSDEEIVHLATDTRKIRSGKQTLFIALRGPRHDGHAFIGEAISKGVRSFLVADESPITVTDCNVIVTQDPQNALQQLAAAHRKRFDIPVIGITGSNGKTIVKEWLTFLLSHDRYVVSNPLSFNSQIGVPLSVWNISPSHQTGIFEAGISEPGEMERLQAIIRPNQGIFTNIGTAHDEGFADRAHKTSEKAILFRDCEQIFYCRDHAGIHKFLSAEYPSSKLVSWSCRGHDAPYRVAMTVNGDHSIIRINDADFSVNFTDQASLENLTHCLVFMLENGYEYEKLRSWISSLRNVGMRLELKEGNARNILIDDTYNNDLAGLRSALDFLQHQHQYKRKSVILSDLLQTGLSEIDLRKKLEQIFAGQSFENFITVGSPYLKQLRINAAHQAWYGSTDELLNALDQPDLSEQVVLVKGARPFTFEAVVSHLQKKVHATQLEINLNALAHNLNYYRSRLDPGTRVMAMVKAFAYGSGSHEIATVLQYHNIDYLGVAYTDEGAALREKGITLPIMVMNSDEGSFPKMMRYKLEPVIFSFSLLEAALNFAPKGEPGFRIHLKLDTGMHRLGFMKDNLHKLTAILAEEPQLEIASIFSHLAAADDPVFEDFTLEQLHSFRQMTEAITEVINGNPLLHILNTAGVMNYPEHQFDMIRLGIGMYGVEPTGRFAHELQPVGRLRSVISQVRTLKKGDTIGYGRAGRIERDTRSGTVAIGYADGYRRAFSQGKGKVMINGQLAPVLGNVCMDMIMVDLTGIEAREGDEVVVFGPELPISEVAEWIDTIPYEVLAGVSERVKRVFIYS